MDRFCIFTWGTFVACQFYSGWDYLGVFDSSWNYLKCPAWTSAVPLSLPFSPSLHTPFWLLAIEVSSGERRRGTVSTRVTPIVTNGSSSVVSTHSVQGLLAGWESGNWHQLPFHRWSNFIVNKLQWLAHHYSYKRQGQHWHWASEVHVSGSLW